MTSYDEAYARFETIYYIRLKYLKFMTEVGAILYGPSFVWRPRDIVQSLENSVTALLSDKKRWLLEEIRK